MSITPKINIKLTIKPEFLRMDLFLFSFKLRKPKIMLESKLMQPIIAAKIAV